MRAIAIVLCAAVTLGSGVAWAEPPAAEADGSKATVVSDGPVIVSTRLTPDPSNVGDLLVLEVVAGFPRDVRVNLPTKLSFEPLHHVRTVEGEPEPTGDGLRKTFKVELQHFEVGEAEIPSFPVTYVDADGGVHTVDVPAHRFVVESLLANEDDPQRRGEDPPISREYADTTAEIVLWSALATLLLGLIAWLLVARFWRRRQVDLGPPPVPAHEIALEALDELERGELLQQGEVQRYYVELTEIAKGYLERRFGVLALDRTTEEIREVLERDMQRVAPLSAEELMAFLGECDLVKFARLKPADTEAQQALGSVRTMVEGSIEVTPVAPEAAAAESTSDGSEAGPQAESTSDAEASEPTAAVESAAQADSMVAVEAKPGLATDEDDDDATAEPALGSEKEGPQ